MLKLCRKTNYAIQTTVNLLFNDMWCYLVIALFNLKIGAFQQTVVRVYWKLLGK